MSDVVSDISCGCESVKVLIDKKLLNRVYDTSYDGFEYIRENIIGEDADESIRSLFEDQFEGCDCDCTVRSDSSSPCHITSSSNTCKTNLCSCVSRFGSTYDQDSRLIGYSPSDPVMRPIFECNCMCSCSVQCTNRLVQHGVRIPMEIFDTGSTTLGLAVRTLKKIPAMTFVCEYVGEIVSRSNGEQRIRERTARGESNYVLAVIEQALDSSNHTVNNPINNKSSDKFSIEMDEKNSKVVQCDNTVSSTEVLNSKPCSTEVSDIETFNENKVRHIQVTENYEKNNISNANKDSMNKHIATTYIDARRYGNVSRFINHSCTPNLFMVPVHVDNMIPCAALFALRDIEAGEILSYDYANGSGAILTENNKEFELKRTVCLCGSSNCKGYLPSAVCI